LGPDHISLGSGHAYGRGNGNKGLWIGGWVIGWMTKPRFRDIDSDNGTWIGGVKYSCHRYQSRNGQSNCCSSFHSGGSSRFWLNRFSVHYKLTAAKDFQGASDFVNSLFPYDDLAT
jgi:hypothetical protein